MRPYDLLIRLQRQRLDPARVALGEATERVEGVRRASEALRVRMAAEPDVVRADPDLAPELGPFLDAARGKLDELEGSAAKLERERERHLAELQTERVELRRLELLDARAERRRERDRAHREERELADLIFARRGR